MPDNPSYQELRDRVTLIEQELARFRQREISLHNREKSLAESEEKFRVLFERTPLSYQSLDAEGRFLEVNQAWLETLGYSREEVIGRSFSDFLEPDWVAHFQENFPRFKAIGEVLGVEFVMRKKDGTDILVAFNGKIGRDSGGNFLQTHCIFNDISERRRSEEALRESLHRYRVIFENSPLGMISFDHAGTVLDCNEKFIEMSGSAREELIGFKIDDDSPPRMREALKKALAGEPAVYEDAYTSARSRKTAFIRAVFNPVTPGQAPSAVIATFENVTDRRKIEETQMFLLACDRSPSDEDFFLALARFLADLLEIDDVRIDRLEGDQLAARTVAIYHDGQFLDNATCTLHDTPGGATAGQAIRCFVRDVRHRYPKDAVLQEMGAESYVGTTLWDSRGRAIGLITLISRRVLENPGLAESILNLVASRAAGELERRDTEREKALLQSQLLQSQKLESIGRLAGGVAHDFNNMLVVILGHAEMAEDQVEAGTPLFGDLQEIRRAAERSAALTRQLLAFARKQTASPKVLDLNQTIENLLKMLRRLIGEDIDLTWLPGKNLWPVRIDPTQVDQILANLAVNGRDAIAGVGRITIETANVIADGDYCSEVADLTPGEYVLLTVSDDGCGMDEQTCQHIFEPFFTTKEIGRGTGLGLATIYGIVKQNGGFINVHSEPGRGTTFAIHLPRHLPAADPPARETLAETVHPGRETILLVEDEPAILQLGTHMLAKLGYRVLAATTPGQAIDLAEHHKGPIDLLLTDVIMPEMNGRDLARRLQTLRPQVRLLFMSGYTADAIARHGVLEEGVQFIQKPFSLAELSAKVRQALGTDNLVT